MDFSKLVKERYSVRTFDQRPVTREELDRLLETVSDAPTACNNQPQRYLVLTTGESMDKLAQCTRYTFHAPCAIVVCQNTTESWVNSFDNENKGDIDAAIVGTYLMLAIHDQGLGSCWVGSFDAKRLAELFNLPDHVKPVAIFPLGHPAENSKPASKHFERKEPHLLTVYESF